MLNTKRFFLLLFCIYLFFQVPTTGISQALSVSEPSNPKLITVGDGWARNSVNTVIFRQNSVTTFENTQYTAFYDHEGFMVLAKRERNSADWEIHKTEYKANVEDAHNSISIEVDGNGVLHVSWGLHGDELLYAQSKEPESIELGETQIMTGNHEDGVTYPAFYRLKNGDLLFLYRYGISGDGHVMINRYHLASGSWRAIAHPLIDGQSERNAYVNSLAIDREGGWHLSWTWRETWDVATNHDIMYAFSPDEGKTWQRSNGEIYSLPITLENAEVACEIPQGSELINQTSMTVNSAGEPVIAAYWRPENGSSPQYHIVWKNDTQWTARQITHRTSTFSLSGGGTKRIPISRPQIVAGDKHELYIVFRDLERGGGISVASSAGADYNDWEINDIYSESLEMWEPTYDPHMWKQYHELHLFVQKTGQGDGETLQEMDPQPVSILKWKP